MTNSFGPMRAKKIPVTALVAGVAAGPALVLDEALSLWGGLDSTTGLITDRHHPQRGRCVSGTILFMASGRGSSSAASVLAEAIRLGTAPLAFVLNEPDEILAVGSLVAQELYGATTPIVLARPEDASLISSGQLIEIEPPILRFQAP